MPLVDRSNLRPGRFCFSSDWVTDHQTNWQMLFGQLAGRPDVRFLEVGSFEGRSTIWWLRNIVTHDSSFITCVDPWHAVLFGHRMEFEERFNHNLACARLSHKVRKMKGESRRLLGALSQNSFDAAYIDGSHAPMDALLDGLMVLPLIRPGAVLLFDDYDLAYSGQPTMKPVRRAVDQFLALAGDAIEVIHRGWQLAVRKRDRPSLVQLAVEKVNPHLIDSGPLAGAD